MSKIPNLNVKKITIEAIEKKKNLKKKENQIKIAERDHKDSDNFRRMLIEKFGSEALGSRILSSDDQKKLKKSLSYQF